MDNYEVTATRLDKILIENIFSFEAELHGILPKDPSTSPGISSAK